MTGTAFSGSFFFCSTFLLGTPLGSSVNTRLHLGKKNESHKYSFFKNGGTYTNSILIRIDNRRAGILNRRPLDAKGRKSDVVAYPGQYKIQIL